MGTSGGSAARKNSASRAVLRDRAEVRATSRDTRATSAKSMPPSCAVARAFAPGPQVFEYMYEYGLRWPYAPPAGVHLRHRRTRPRRPGRRPPYAPGPRRLDRHPPRLAHRRRRPVRTPRRGGALAGRAAPDVRQRGHRPPAARPLRRGRGAARRRTGAGPRRPERPLPRPELGEPFATAGLCFYRDGRDSVAWHGDRTGRGDSHDTMVAIVSLGEPRPLLLRPRGGGGAAVRRPLGHGDLIVMGGSCQRTWDHAIPKTRGGRRRPHQRPVPPPGVL